MCRTKKSNQKKRPPKTCPSSATRGALRFSRRAALTKLSRAIPGPRPAGAASGDNRARARFIPRCARSDNARLAPPDAAMLGGVNGTGVATSGSAVYSLFHRSQLRSARGPRWCSRASQPFPGESACLSDRAQRGSPRAPETAISAGQSQRSGDQAFGVPFSLPSFFWASKRKKGWRAEPSAFKTIGAKAPTNPRHQENRQFNNRTAASVSRC